MRRHRVLIIILSLIILLLGLSYSVFNQIFSVEGEVIAHADFNVPIASSIVKTASGASDTIAVISDGGKKLNITTNLAAPGSFVEVESIIFNYSDVDVELNAVNITGDDVDITVDIIPVPVIGEVIPINGQKTFIIKITWNSASVVTSKTINFSIEFIYQQSI